MNGKLLIMNCVNVYYNYIVPKPVTHTHIVKVLICYIAHVSDKSTTINFYDSITFMLNKCPASQNTLFPEEFQLVK